MLVKSKIGQWFGGCFLLIAGFGLTLWEWHSVLGGGGYSPHISAVSPALAVMGLGIMFSPIDYERLKAEHGVDRVKNFEQLPEVLKIWSAVALLAGLGNWYAIAQQ